MLLITIAITALPLMLKLRTFNLGVVVIDSLTTRSIQNNTVSIILLHLRYFAILRYLYHNLPHDHTKNQDVSIKNVKNLVNGKHQKW